MDFEDSREETPTKNYKSTITRASLAIGETREVQLKQAREYVKAQIEPFAKKCVFLEPYWDDMHPTFHNFCRHVLSSNLAHTNPTIGDLMYNYGIQEYSANLKGVTTPLMQEISDIYEQEKRTFEEKPEASRIEISTQEFKSALSSINSVREQKLLQAHEFVINQIRPFAKQCVRWKSRDLTPNFRNFYQYARSRVYSAELDSSFFQEVFNDLNRSEFFTNRNKETTPLMKEIMRIYKQEKEAFEIEIQNACNDVLKLIADGNFHVQNNTNNCIKVDYLTKYVLCCDLELYKSIANDYLQQICPKNCQKLSVIEIDISGWVLELELKK